MAKSKNSSQHNQSKKAHRNGIKKPKTNRYPSLNGTDPKFRRNHRYALHGTTRALKEKAEGKRINDAPCAPRTGHLVLAPTSDMLLHPSPGRRLDEQSLKRAALDGDDGN
ncbi:60S ribosomal protein L29 [Diaporthe eres]|nr:60S ribosomal protein L29 [Diaporthe eres]